MAEEIKENTGSETKAGLMEENSDKIEEIKESVPSDQDTGRTPKISKDEAEDQGRERPLH